MVVLVPNPEGVCVPVYCHFVLSRAILIGRANARVDVQGQIYTYQRAHRQDTPSIMHCIAKEDGTH